MIEQLIQTVSRHEAPDTPEGRTNRFADLMHTLLEIIPGNIVEIGAGHGHSTKVFLEAAKSKHREVLVIDPWQSDVVGYGVYSVDEFMERTKGYDNLSICKMPSYYKGVNKYLSKISPIAFAFVDGLQLKEHVLSDLFLMSAYDAQVICVDDINRSTAISQVPAAVEKFLQGNNRYKKIETKVLIECYLIKSS